MTDKPRIPDTGITQPAIPALKRQQIDKQRKALARTVREVGEQEPGILSHKFLNKLQIKIYESELSEEQALQISKAIDNLMAYLQEIEDGGEALANFPTEELRAALGEGLTREVEAYLNEAEEAGQNFRQQLFGEAGEERALDTSDNPQSGRQYIEAMFQTLGGARELETQLFEGQAGLEQRVQEHYEQVAQPGHAETTSEFLGRFMAQHKLYTEIKAKLAENPNDQELIENAVLFLSNFLKLVSEGMVGQRGFLIYSHMDEDDLGESEAERLLFLVETYQEIAAVLSELLKVKGMLAKA